MDFDEAIVMLISYTTALSSSHLLLIIRSLV